MTVETWIGFLLQPSALAFSACLFLVISLFHFRTRGSRLTKSVTPQVPVLAPIPTVPVANTAPPLPLKPLLRPAPSETDPLLYKRPLNYGRINPELIRRRWNVVKRKLPECHSPRSPRKKNRKKIQNNGGRLKTEALPAAPFKSSRESNNLFAKPLRKAGGRATASAARENFFEKPKPTPAEDFFDRNHRPAVPGQQNKKSSAANTFKSDTVNVADALRENFFDPRMLSAEEDFFHPQHVLPTPNTTSSLTARSKHKSNVADADTVQVPRRPIQTRAKSIGHVQTETLFHQVECELKLLEAMYRGLGGGGEDVVPRLKEIETRLSDESNRGKVRYVLDTTPVGGRTNADELRAHRKALSRRTETLLVQVQARLQRMATPQGADSSVTTNTIAMTNAVTGSTNTSAEVVRFNKPVSVL